MAPPPGVIAMAMGSWFVGDVFAKSRESRSLSSRVRPTATGLLGGLGGALSMLLANSLFSVLPLLAVAAVTVAGGAMIYRTGRRLKSSLKGASRSLFQVARQGNSYRMTLWPEQLGRLYLLSGTIKQGTGEDDFYFSRTEGLEVLWYLRVTGEYVEFMERDPTLRAAQGSALEPAVRTATTDKILGKARIVERSSISGKVVIDLDKLLLEDLFGLKGALEDYYGANLEIERDLSPVEEVKAFARNVEVTARMTFLKNSDGGEEDAVVDEANRVPLTLRYSLSALPEPGFRSRFADQRIGYFTQPYEDWSNETVLNVTRHLITRWRLEKTDPSSKLSRFESRLLIGWTPRSPGSIGILFGVRYSIGIRLLKIFLVFIEMPAYLLSIVGHKVLVATQLKSSFLSKYFHTDLPLKSGPNDKENEI